MIHSAAHLCDFQPFACVIGVGGVVHAHRNRIRIEVAGVDAELTIAVIPAGVSVSIAAYGQ